MFLSPNLFFIDPLLLDVAPPKHHPPVKPPREPPLLATVPPTAHAPAPLTAASPTLSLYPLAPPGR